MLLVMCTGRQCLSWQELCQGEEGAAVQARGSAEQGASRHTHRASVLPNHCRHSQLRGPSAPCRVIGQTQAGGEFCCCQVQEAAPAMQGFTLSEAVAAGGGAGAWVALAQYS
jgi:hypothetical protein